MQDLAFGKFYDAMKVTALSYVAELCGRERASGRSTRRRWWWRRGTHCFVTFPTTWMHLLEVNDDARVAVHHTRSGHSSQYLSSSKRRNLLPPPTTRCRRQLTNQPVTSNDAQRSAMYPPSQRRRRRRAHTCAPGTGEREGDRSTVTHPRIYEIISQPLPESIISPMK